MILVKKIVIRNYRLNKIFIIRDSRKKKKIIRDFRKKIIIRDSRKKNIIRDSRKKKIIIRDSRKKNYYTRFS